MNSDQYVAEIKQTRGDIDRTLLRLEDKLSPRELWDRAVRWSGGPKELSENLGRTVRDNPIPATLLAISLAWLLIAGTSKTSRYGYDPERERLNRKMADIDPRVQV